MSDTSTRLALPYIQPAQAQKHVTHNEAIRVLDAVAQLSVVGFGATTPPALAQEGDIYALGAGAVDAWAGHDGEIAIFGDGYWQFLTPRTGWIATLDGSAEIRVWDGAVWAEPGPGPLDNLNGVGVNTTHDATNRLAVSAPATLFTHEGAGHQLKINKASAGDTASILWQDNWSGRAEMGLAGDDDLHLKVSADGAVWTEALVIDAASGRATFPAGVSGMTERLSANLTFYVRSDGSDANDGLTDTASGAFRTVQHAVDVAAGLYCGPFTVTVQIGAGAFNEGTRLLVPGNGNLRLTLAGSGAGTTTISGSAYGMQITGACMVTVQNLTITGVTVGLWARYGAQVFLRGNVEFAGGSARLLGADNGAYVEVLSCNLLIGAAPSAYLVYASGGGHIYLGSGVTVVTTAPVTFTATVFSNLTSIAQIIASQVTWDETAGAISGARFNASSNGVINTAGGGASYLPGTSAGVISTGGQYV